MGSYRISDHIDANAAPDVVMKRILDPHSWIDWQSEIKTIEGPPSLEEGDEVTGDAALVGFQVRGRSEALVVTDNLFVEDVLVGVRMVVTYEVAPSPTGARITRTLEADMPRGVAGRVLIATAARAAEEDAEACAARASRSGGGSGRLNHLGHRVHKVSQLTMPIGSSMSITSRWRKPPSVIVLTAFKRSHPDSPLTTSRVMMSATGVSSMFCSRAIA